MSRPPKLTPRPAEESTAPARAEGATLKELTEARRASLGCANVPFPPFSVTQLRIRSGSSCLEADPSAECRPNGKAG